MKKIMLLTLMIPLALAVKSQDERPVGEAKGLDAGVEAPVFSAVDAAGKRFHLEEALGQGPVVIIFYRGHWCPVCNKHLGQIQDSLEMITDRGATVIAVSPQKPEYLGKMAEKTGTQYTLLYDKDYAIADAYDVTFTPTSVELVTYNTLLGAKMKEAHSDDSQRLPIPATYVVSRDGKIAWRQFDPNYKNRSSIREIINALDRIR